MDSLCHPGVTATNLSYRFPIFETSATALCGTTGKGGHFSYLCWINHQRVSNAIAKLYHRPWVGNFSGEFCGPVDSKLTFFRAQSQSYRALATRSNTMIWYIIVLSTPRNETLVKRREIPHNLIETIEWVVFNIRTVQPRKNRKIKPRLNNDELFLSGYYKILYMIPVGVVLKLKGNSIYNVINQLALMIFCDEIASHPCNNQDYGTCSPKVGGRPSAGFRAPNRLQTGSLTSEMRRTCWNYNHCTSCVFFYSVLVFRLFKTRMFQWSHDRTI